MLVAAQVHVILEEKNRLTEIGVALDGTTMLSKKPNSLAGLPRITGFILFHVYKYNFVYKTANFFLRISEVPVLN